MGPCGADGFPPRADSLGARVLGCFSFGSVSFDFLARLGDFVGVISIHGVLDVFCEFRFRFEMSVVGVGRFS